MKIIWAGYVVMQALIGIVGAVVMPMAGLYGWYIVFSHIFGG